MPGAASSRFHAQLVMMDDKRRLRRSKRHGELVLGAANQSVKLVYPRLGRYFQRKFEQPLKCVLGRQLLRVYSSNGKRSFTCRLLSEEDAAKCAETLRGFGVEIIHVGEAMLSTAGSNRTSVRSPDAAVVAGAEAALRAVREASLESIQAEIRDYEDSSQLQVDTEAVVRAMFSAEH
ncbi:hypothetical protein PRNP1_000044 [Phytophthora ramorum]